MGKRRASFILPRLMVLKAAFFVKGQRGMGAVQSDLSNVLFAQAVNHIHQQCCANALLLQFRANVIQQNFSMIIHKNKAGDLLLFKVYPAVIVKHSKQQAGLVGFFQPYLNLTFIALMVLNAGADTFVDDPYDFGNIFNP